MVTNAGLPGQRCYGFVTMSSIEEAVKCVERLNKTELHGKVIRVEKASNKNKPNTPGDRTENKQTADAKKSKSLH